MNDFQYPLEDKDPGPTLNYIGDMLNQLARLAQDEGQGQLALAIQMAALQAAADHQGTITPN
jgi:hypothetical protein